MTLADLDQMFAETLMEYEGTDAVGDVFSRTRMILRAVDWMAQQTDAFWYAFQLPLVNGQTEYCAPAIYKLRSLNTADEYGVFQPLLPKTVGEMDGMSWGRNWRNWESSSNYRQYVIVEGMNRIIVAPPPYVPTLVSPQVAPLIEFEGYAIPSKACKSDGITPLFAADTDECPLNAACHAGVVYQAMVLRTMQRPTQENMARLPLIQRERDTYLGNLATFAMNFTPPYRFDQRKYRWGC